MILSLSTETSRLKNLWRTCAIVLVLSGLAFIPSAGAQELSQAIGERILRVPEFEFIRDESKRLGVRSYLFGGTAAAFAHYVKWDLLREAGDSRYQPDRFDYDYSNIFRSTQDLDIVIDGDPEQAAELEKKLREKYPHLQGSKSAWEVRLLRQKHGDKEALLDNPEFLRQHTDSNSTGLIEIGIPTKGQSRVRDLRDWQSKNPNFLKDVAEGKLHYYFSPEHALTKRFREGLNPPIFSVIRYLTKAFQYELEIRPEDERQIQAIINEFNPKRDLQNSYAQNWIEKNGKKLFQHAVNLDFAAQTLDRLGLRSKLMALSPRDKIDSLGWWLNRQPLGAMPLGKGKGKTASELGIKVVAHTTSDFLAYESITRAHTGDPNVFISRAGIAGEAAAHGNGFYTAIGKAGARNSGMTIRFDVDPKAREGTDFILVAQGRAPKTGDYVVFKNKSALKVIPESLNLSPVEYFKLLIKDSAIEDNDRGILEKLKRRMTQRSSTFTKKEIDEIASVMKRHFRNPEQPWSIPALKEWFSLPQSQSRPDVFEAFLDHIDGAPIEIFDLTLPQFSYASEILTQKILKTPKLELINFGLTCDSQKTLRLIQKNPAVYTPTDYFEWLTTLDGIWRRGDPTMKAPVEKRLAKLSQEELAQIASIVESHIQTDQYAWSPTLTEWFALPQSGEHPEVFQTFLDDPKTTVASNVTLDLERPGLSYARDILADRVLRSPNEKSLHLALIKDSDRTLHALKKNLGLQRRETQKSLLSLLCGNKLFQDSGPIWAETADVLLSMPSQNGLMSKDELMRKFLFDDEHYPDRLSRFIALVKENGPAYQAVVDWLKHDENARRKAAKSLVPQITGSNRAEQVARFLSLIGPLDISNTDKMLEGFKKYSPDYQMSDSQFKARIHTVRLNSIHHCLRNELIRMLSQ